MTCLAKKLLKCRHVIQQFMTRLNNEAALCAVSSWKIELNYNKTKISASLYGPIVEGYLYTRN